MKRVLILAAVAAIAATACNKTYEVNPTPGVPIGFGTWTEHLTKAEQRVPGTNTFLAGDTFNVYGYKTINNANTVVFNGDVVTAYDANNASAGGTVSYWKYETLRFWDPAATSYTFFAVSPAGLLSSANAQTGAFTSNPITFSGENNDILVADKTTVKKTDGGGNFNNFGTVHMVFNHVASLVDVKVKKAPALQNATVTVTALSLENIENVGVMTVSADYNGTTTAAANNTNGPVATWSTTDDKDAYGPDKGVTHINLPATVANDANFPRNDESTAPSTDQATFLINNLVVKPQIFDTTKDNDKSQKLTITYKISVTNGGENTYTGSVWLADFDKIDDTDQTDTKVASWEPGKHYVLYLTLNANAITFTASINNWATSTNGYHYLIQ